MSIILSDFSQLAISGIMATLTPKEINDPDSINDIRTIILSQILSLKTKFKGEMILCCDSKNYWRKDAFPYYKGHRKHLKSKDKIDWNKLHGHVDNVKSDLKEYFPFKLIEVEKAEGDDVIAILVKYLQENDLNEGTLFETPQDITICSSDHDFKQLHKYKNVKQWSNAQKKFVICDTTPEEYIIEHTVKGDGGDNIPNIYSGDWWAKARSEGTSIRAISAKESRLEGFYNDGIDSCQNAEERKNFKRNRMLVDFDYIPDDICDSIIKSYEHDVPSGNRGTIFDYMIKYRLKMLLKNIDEFC